MTSHVVYVMGHEVRALPKALLSDPPSSVSLRRLGGAVEATYFTPEEARRFGEAMILAAKEAEAAR